MIRIYTPKLQGEWFRAGLAEFKSYANNANSVGIHGTQKGVSCAWVHWSASGDRRIVYYGDVSSTIAAGDDDWTIGIVFDTDEERAAIRRAIEETPASFDFSTRVSRIAKAVEWAKGEI